MKHDGSNKLRARSDKCYFVGYPKKTKGYHFYHPLEKKVFVLRHTTFLENEILLGKGSESKIKLDEAQKP